ncbi:VV A32 virion packagIng ATPase [Heterosigma akashiwo virus 01]|uniref:AGB-1 n=1 Tax=Heterosigma akashiwo virus 01 TaxID=97195 RepID=Q91DI0_HAV01|nr:VV A32 virion packagIng ATPase [Heterosigma akashiwo virus 01]AOM63359.1 VV A32 virion packagIng ATPase [Heterosigma akashiwo virus 01]BAB69884.1 AGB-1 [Heterosigma akashiwo virus 01]
MELQIKKFDNRSVVDKRRKFSSPIIVVIGKRNTGKSELIKNIMFCNSDIPSGIIISPTESGNSFYSDFCPGIFVHSQYDSELIKKIIKRQKKLIKKKGKHPSNDFFIILDDCMYDSKTIGRDINIREIFLNGRHYQIFLILSLQYVMDLPVSLRSNIDYVFCLRENNLQNVEKLYKSFFGIFPSKIFFNQAFSKITENYGSIVLDNTSRSNRIDECIFWFRATFPLPNFRIGNKKLWKMHDKYYEDVSDASEDEKESKAFDDIKTKTSQKLKTILTNKTK